MSCDVSYAAPNKVHQKPSQNAPHHFTTFICYEPNLSDRSQNQRFRISDVDADIPFFLKLNCIILLGTDQYEHNLNVR